MAFEWAVIRTHYNKERVTKLDLDAQGHSTYLPLARQEHRRKNGLLVAHIRPLFTTYLFVEIDIAGRAWEELLYNPGVKQFVGYRDGQHHPLIVRKADMMELRRRIAEYGDAVPVGLSRPKFIPPDTLVQILEGPFRDFSAIVEADKGSRIKVLLHLFGRSQSLELPRACLAIAV